MGNQHDALFNDIKGKSTRFSDGNLGGHYIHHNFCPISRRYKNH